MSDAALPEAQDNQPPKPPKKVKRRRKDAKPKSVQKKTDILSIEDCLHKLSLLPGLITMKAITTAQANAIRNTYSTILQQLRQGQAGQQQLLPNESVLEIAQFSPQTLNLLAPMLTDTQVQMLMERSEGDEDE